MTAFVKEDVLKGTQGVQDVWGWSELDRLIFVGGITSVSFVDKIAEAKSAASLSMGDEHPTETNLTLQKISAIALANDVIQLNCLYKRDDEFKGVEVDATIGYVETNKDIHNADMTLTYTYEAGTKIHADGEPLADDYEDTVGYTTNKPIPLLTYKISGSVASVNPNNWAGQYVGKVNSSTWQGKDARTWLCTRIRMLSKGSMGGEHPQYGFTEDTNNIYAVTAEWKYKPQGWDETAVFIMANGKPVPNPTIEDGSKAIFEICDETNFSGIESTILN